MHAAATRLDERLARIGLVLHGVHESEEGGVVDRERHVGGGDCAESSIEWAGCRGGIRHRPVQSFETVERERIEQRALVAEVPSRRRMTDAGIARELAE